MKHIKKWLPLIIFLAVCFVFGSMSLLIIYQNPAVIALLIISAAAAFYIGDLSDFQKDDDT
jgi:Ca2+/H+ antiporter